MFRISMFLGCMFVTNSAVKQQYPAVEDSLDTSDGGYTVTCYMCVNVSDNPVCNQYAIDRPCTAGQTFCHTLHIMDSRGSTVLVNKKCATEMECQLSKVGCVQIDTQTICVSCCDQNYCNVHVPTNSSNATFDDKNTKLRIHAKNLFNERDKALKAIMGTGTVSYKSPTYALIIVLLNLLGML